MNLRLPVRIGYEEVDLGGHHTYRNIETSLVLFEELDRCFDIDQAYNRLITLIKLDCEDYIIGGFDSSVLGRGPLHYSLGTIKQNDMKNIKERIDKGAEIIYWRDSSRSTYEEYTPEQFLKLYEEANVFIMLNKLYSDILEEKATYYYKHEDIDSMKATRWGYEPEENELDYIVKQISEIFSLDREEIIAYIKRFFSWK